MSQTPDPYAARPAPLSPGEERNLGTLAHAIPLVAMVVSVGFLGFIASLVMYLVYRDRGPFVRENAANSLNIQITVGIILIVSFPLMLILIGFVTFLLAIVLGVVLHIIGVLKANRGEWWRPPMTFRFVR
jgi:uncharacterized Tic20 family protein